MVTNDNIYRAGKYIVQIGRYKAFVPKSLPPDPPIKIDDELLQPHSQADIALGRLSGTSKILPNPDLFVAMYVHEEQDIFFPGLASPSIKEVKLLQKLQVN